MFCVIPLLLFVSNALALPTANKPYYDLADAEKYFADFIEKYDKKYECDKEYEKRFEIFKNALIKINEMNADESAIYGVTEFIDLTSEEFTRRRLGHVSSKSTRRNDDEMVTVKQEWIDDAPDSLDYREQDLVTEVKDQGLCGSCYVFSAIGNIEGQYAKKHKQLVSFSEQQGLDCGLESENCETGGFGIDVMRSLAAIGGSEREEDYPYEESDGQCRTDKSKIVAKILGAQLVNTSTEEQLKGALVHYGPLSVSLYMPHMSYWSGVISPKYCTGKTNHEIVIVGYGTDADSGKDYWLIKNSWGIGFGEDGYFRLERGKQLCRLGEEGAAVADVE